MKKLRLNDKASIPVLGFGTWELIGEDCVRGVTSALEIGYRHIDTADRYRNHKEVAKGMKQSGIQRKEIFLTTKIYRENLHHDDVLENCERYLQELETDYIDLFLIHWPNKDIPLAETLIAMNQLKKAGKIRAIGVSNFTPHHLQDALDTGVEITNNQVELHPSFNQKALRAFCAAHTIVVTAYSPLGRGIDLQIPLVKELAKKYGVSASQIILNWLTSQDIVAIPKATKPERIKDNFQSLSWTMEPDDIEKITTLPQKEKMLQPPHNEFDY